MALGFKKIKCEQVENREDQYDLTIETYKEKLEGRFDLSQIRYLIQELDNSIH